MSESEANQKQKIAAVFGRAAPTYDRTGRFAYFGQRLVAAVDLAPGARVLDVASGRGAVLFPAAEAVGPQGQVTGIDLSGPMVEATSAKIQSRGLTHAEVLLMDAERMTLAERDVGPKHPLFESLVCLRPGLLGFAGLKNDC